jgi:hypothetical protein
MMFLCYIQELKCFTFDISCYIQDDPSILTTEKAEIFYQALSTMTIQDTLDDGN